jgi:hypothetical protein
VAKELDEYEIFYEEVGTNDLVPREVGYEEGYEEEVVETAPGLNAEDVYKLSDDLRDQARFDEQIDPRREQVDEDL